MSHPGIIRTLSLHEDTLLSLHEPPRGHTPPPGIQIRVSDSPLKLLRLLHEHALTHSHTLSHGSSGLCLKSVVVVVVVVAVVVILQIQTCYLRLAWASALLSERS
ncbi:hypothetical protein OYC64_015284 [Pagothenia borchgrevinki]|uniref:Uncharacterized protein n=1 Tax=Pagothenia borchgrevinki TaxID=8213 RepID=A0ABD2HG72_PAGBO